ncbi:MAG: ribonuclease P protein component [candidate division WOR-3 bacterium]|nr:ribonuclease P protein component [candidate division WOR-3 bacterium]
MRNKKEIDELFLTGRRFNFNDLTIIYKPSTLPKVGFFASGKIKGAVKRNRVKRLLREAYRMNKEIFIGFKVIFHAKDLLDAKEILEAFDAFRKERKVL